jgi:hypothetical protein
VKRVVFGGVLVLLAGFVTSLVLLPADWQNWLGFSRAAYFTNGQNYAFYSGIGPMLLTASLGSGVLVTMWHSLNCHKEGCWRVSRHKVNGSPWCNLHHEEARLQRNLESMLAELIDLLKGQASES